VSNHCFSVGDELVRAFVCILLCSQLLYAYCRSLKRVGVEVLCEVVVIGFVHILQLHEVVIQVLNATGFPLCYKMSHKICLVSCTSFT
jgi:hypothetical protein